MRTVVGEARTIGEPGTKGALADGQRILKLKKVVRRIPKASALIIIGLVLCAIFAPLIAPHDPLAQNLVNSLKPPFFQKGGSVSHLLGTDSLGRDILSRMIYGARVSAIVGFAGVLFSGLIGTFLGVLAGYFGGKIDAVIMRVTDMMLSLPYILIAIAIIGAIGPSLRNIIIVLAITQWVGYTRIIRFEAMSLSKSEFVEMAVISGSRWWRILLTHILPNVLNSAVVLATLDVGKMIVFESALSFLGLGVKPPTPSWGGMLADGRIYLTVAWWIATLPGVAIVITVLGGNLLGDWLRDELDPRHQLKA
ncbi:MAG TPA: ABC transporter permease [Syntrophorhabdales bacterium]|nr:ABC transporter permease [Syntrophorhabdales bacterium]